MARTPDVCRPFAAAMGDRRPARQCVAEFPADRARTLAAMAADGEGAGRGAADGSTPLHCAAQRGHVDICRHARARA